MNKIVMFTHNDLDGVGCGVVLERFESLLFASNKTEISYCSYQNVDKKITDTLSELRNYEELPTIIISDLGITEDTARKVDAYEGEKVLLDHHKTNEWIADKYGWAVIDTSRSGTLLVYKHLFGVTEVDDLQTFASLVDDYDRWIHNFPKSIKMNRLFFLLGIDKFVKRCRRFNIHEFTDYEEMLIDVEEENINKYVDNLNKHISIFNSHDDKNYGIVYADRYQSEVAHELIERNNLNMVTLIDANKGTVSMRSKDEFDVGKIASRLGGGGHKNASGAKLNPEIFNEILNELVEEIQNEHSKIETEELSKVFGQEGE